MILRWPCGAYMGRTDRYHFCDRCIARVREEYGLDERYQSLWIAGRGEDIRLVLARYLAYRYRY